MLKVNLNKIMNELYATTDYFARIPHPEEPNFEEEYHGTVIDPDGNNRTLKNERDSWLAGVKEITDYLDNSKPCRFLDVGCGLGWLLSYLDDKWDKNGVEISEFAHKSASRFGNVHCGTLDNYNKTGFDIIIMNHVIEHLEDPISTLKKIKNMINPNGTFIIGTPDFDCGAARRYGDGFRLLHDPTHISLFSCDSMHRCLRDIGFKIKKVEFPYFDTPWFNKEDVEKILKKERISPPYYGSNMTFFCGLGE